MALTAAPAANLYLYLHTHWDREWYQPFEVYRANLVKVVSDIIERLKNDDLEHFLLDGQASVLDDVLEVKPHLAEDISALMKQGRLSAGPWYVLADQLLVSGESLIRNLKMGIEVTEKLGPAAMIGYCPDTFGHTADMPRLLRGFDISSAFVWRGVPELAGPIFIWQSPDGSQVVTYQLAKGYYQTVFHTEPDPAKLDAYLSNWVSDAEGNRAATFCPLMNGVLVPVGGDHVAPPRHFAQQLQAIGANGKAKAKGKGDRRKVSTVSLPEFADYLVSEIPRARLPVFDGELRDNLSAKRFERAYVLQGVLSTRLYLKRENRLAERRITRIVEPMHALLRLTGRKAFPQLELAYAWKLLLQNQPHDSICGCSVDEVHDEMQMRTKKFNQVLDALGSEAVASLFDSGAGTPAVTAAYEPLVDPDLKANKLVVANLSGEPVTQPVPIAWATAVGEKPVAGSHLILDTVMGSADIQIVSSEISTEIFVGTGQEPIVKRVRVNKGWVWSDDLVPMGITELPWASPAVSKSNRDDAMVVVAKRSLSNEWMSLDVHPDGLMSVSVRHEEESAQNGGAGTSRFAIGHKLRDVADCGDTYNFDPLPGDRPVEAKLVDVHTGLSGPLVGSLILTYEIKIPKELTAISLAEESDKPVPDKPGVFRRSKETEVHRITTEVTLKRGVPIAFFDTQWQNKSLDHRLEVVFDTGRTVETTFSENHFSIVSRNAQIEPSKLPVEAGTEAVPDRFPCQRFFIANGQLFLNQGLPEYAVDGSQVSITLLRAVSRLSRPRLTTRGGGAGPPVPTPAANCLGENKVSYAFAPLRRGEEETSRRTLADPARAEAYSLADTYDAPLFATLTCGTAGGPGKALIACDSESVKITSMYFDQANAALFVRLLNTAMSPQETIIRARFAVDDARICRLDEKPIQALKRLPPGSSGDLTQFSAVLALTDNELTTVRFLVSAGPGGPGASNQAAGYNQVEKVRPKRSPATRTKVRARSK